MFDDVRLPEDIEQGASGGPEFQTTITMLSTGVEQRNADWPTSRGKWTIAYGTMNKEDYSAILTFFRARQGRARGFRFKDWADYEGVNEVLGTGQEEVVMSSDGPLGSGGTTIVTPAKTEFQLVKIYDDGLIQYTRKITRPVVGTVKVYVNGVRQMTGWTLQAGGVIRFDNLHVPPTGSTVTASFEFDVPVRFNTDHLPIVLQWEGAGSFSEIEIWELRE